MDTVVSVPAAGIGLPHSHSPHRKHLIASTSILLSLSPALKSISSIGLHGHLSIRDAGVGL
jgi:hypothetical protein